MKWSIIKTGLSAFCLLPLFALSQTTAPADSLTLKQERKWDKRVHLKYERWERLKPTHAKMQYAGGMGVTAFGVGWDYGKRCQWETDFLVGYLPRKYADQFRLTFTVKQNYIPWSLQIKECQVRQTLGHRTFLLRLICDNDSRRRFLEERTRTLSEPLLQFQHQTASVYFHRTESCLQSGT